MGNVSTAPSNLKRRNRVPSNQETSHSNVQNGTGTETFLKWSTNEASRCCGASRFRQLIDLDVGCFRRTDADWHTTQLGILRTPGQAHTSVKVTSAGQERAEDEQRKPEKERDYNLGFGVGLWSRCQAVELAFCFDSLVAVEQRPVQVHPTRVQPCELPIR